MLLTLVVLGDSLLNRATSGSQPSSVCKLASQTRDLQLYLPVVLEAGEFGHHDVFNVRYAFFCPTLRIRWIV